MFKILNQERKWYLVLLLLSIITFFVYLFTSGGTTPYNYFTRLGDAFLHGRYYLQENPSWLNELIPIGQQKFAVVYPPTPAIISMPFVFVFGSNFRQEIISQIMGALAAFIWGVIAFQKTKSRVSSLWLFLLASFGNIVWFMSANGSVWYMGQVSTYLFTTLTIYESLNKKRVPLLVLYSSFAIFSRLQTVFTLPLIIYLNREKFKEIKNLLSFLLGLASFGIIYLVYNYLRFGSFFQTGYSLIPGVLSEPWFQKGIFHPTYILNNIRVMFMSLPIFSKQFPFVKPSWGGLSIWITSPIFVYSLFAKKDDKETRMTWLSIILISFVIFSHGSTGFAQFGYRFAVDFYALIFFLLTKYLGKVKTTWHHWLLLAISIVVNLWGVVFINKFGFVGW